MAAVARSPHAEEQELEEVFVTGRMRDNRDVVAATGGGGGGGACVLAVVAGGGVGTGSIGKRNYRGLKGMAFVLAWSMTWLVRKGPLAREAQHFPTTSSSVDGGSGILEAPCEGKLGVVQILSSAGMGEDEILRRTGNCTSLPTWEQFTDLYGDDPVFLGLETCAAYRSLLSSSSSSAAHVPVVRVAGLYNTGTNLLQMSLASNMPRDFVRDDDWDDNKAKPVPWGKHNPAKDKWHFTAKSSSHENKTLVLPVVIVRDPYRWMLAACKSSYDMHFMEGEGYVCPRLVGSTRTEGGRRVRSEKNLFTSSVVVPHHYLRPGKDDEEAYARDWYASLADMWSKWNMQYLKADYPRVFVRFEDMVFRSLDVVNVVRECVGLDAMRIEDHTYITEPSKSHGKSSDLVNALSLYGKEEGRTAGFTPSDLRYAGKALHKNLMEGLHYLYQHQPPPPPSDTTS